MRPSLLEHLNNSIVYTSLQAFFYRQNAITLQSEIFCFSASCTKKAKNVTIVLQNYCDNFLTMSITKVLQFLNFY